MDMNFNHNVALQFYAYLNTNSSPSIYKRFGAMMLLVIFGFSVNLISAQTDPAITSWLQNTTKTGSYYSSGNSTAIDNGILVNCQSVKYSNSYVYIETKGVPAYPTGPFLDGNPSQAQSQNAIFKFPLNPQKNTGTPTATSLGNIGVFINGVALFDFQDGVAWNTATNSWCGGPGNPPCSGTKYWTRDAVVFERKGFDCSKGHPAMGNYHHHQNPSAFKLDKQVISTICNLYDADGLYRIDSGVHSPLIGYAYDGFPIYGALGYKNADGTGGVVRLKSSYNLRAITSRTQWADGTDVPDGPAVNATYPLGTFKEDYEFKTPTSDDFLDEHNGRFCVTPEYPKGTYAYFTTVDENYNSTFPYVVGPTFYGVKSVQKVTSIGETTTEYKATANVNGKTAQLISAKVTPNPASDLVAVQLGGLQRSDVTITLMDLSGRVIHEKIIPAGSTLVFFELQSVYSGNYLLKVASGSSFETLQLVVQH